MRPRRTATDASAPALAVARRNAARLALDSRIRFRLADCFEPLDSVGPLGRFDLIVSNPPYITDDQISVLVPEIRYYEPRAALAGGSDGLDFYRRIASALTDQLEMDGAAIVEIGAGQSAAVTEIMHKAGAVSIKVISDFAGIPRVIVARLQ
jgi:release factor glutamine methyltransferase